MKRTQEIMQHHVIKTVAQSVFEKKNMDLDKNAQQRTLMFNRFAVVVLFFVSGFMYAGILARLPEMKRLYDVTNGQLGAVLLCSSFGALGAMLGASQLMQHFGSARLASATALMFCLVVPFMPFIPSVSTLIPLFFVLGATVGLLDVSMNSEAVRVEQAFGKPLMSSFHAVYSISGAIGAGVSILATHFEVSLSIHFGFVAAISLIVIIWAGFVRLKYPLDRVFKIEKTNNASVKNMDKDVPKKLTKSRFQILKTVLPIALIAFCSMGSESALSNWSAIYLNKIMGASDADSTWAFAAFATAMTIGRLVGDFMALHLGQQKQLLISSLLALIGFVLALISTLTPLVLFGFFITGLGLATIVPTAFSIAGRTEGGAQGAAVSMVSLFGYTSFFILPPTLGYLSDAYDLRVVLIIPLGLVTLMSFLIGRLSIRKASS